MPPIRVKYVISFSSQDTRHTIENLVKSSGTWLCHSSDRTGRLQADLQLERATTISFLDLGNSGSVMISVEVGRSSWPSSQPLVTLLPTVALMTPAEWRAGKNSTAVRMFKQNDFNSEAVKEKWDKVRIVCTQPFRKDVQFGLSLFRLHTNAEVSRILDIPLTISAKEVITQPPQTNSKKEELVSRMNLPVVKKKTMSQSLGWLENKVLTNGEEPSTGPPSNPFTSPVSRAARLVVMAAKPASKSGAEVLKADLECESLEYLISLNLTIGDINTLKVSNVRRDFENRRQKELTHEEKLIFKNIALDFAGERLGSLEAQQEKAEQKGYKGMTPRQRNGRTPVALKTAGNNLTNLNVKKPVTHSKRTPSIIEITERTKTPQSKNTKDTDSNQRPGSRFTFKPMTSPRNVSLGRQKLRQEDSLDFSSSSGSPRNNVALADSRMATPKRSRNGKNKNSVCETKENEQPNLDGWFTFKSKRKKEHASFSYSATGINPVSSDEEDLPVIVDHNHTPSSRTGAGKVESGGFLTDPTPCIYKHSKPGNDTLASTADTTSSSDAQDSHGGHRLGGAPADRYGMHSKESVDSNRLSPSSHSSQAVMVECPLCSGLFESSAVESHAAVCGIVLSSDSDTDIGDVDESSTVNPTRSQQEKVEECPVCGDLIRSSSLEVHAAACAASAFG